MTASLRHWAARQLKTLQSRVSEQIGGPARQKIIFLLASVLALQSADLSTIGAVGPPLRETFQISNLQIASLTATTLFVSAAAALPVGALVDRVNRTRLLAASILLWTAALIAVGASTSYTMLVLTRLALGIVTATAVPAIASLTGDFFPGSARARVYGYILGGELIGAGFGFLVSGNIAGFAPWRWSFWWLAVPALALAWALWKGLPEPARGGQSGVGPHDPGIGTDEELPRGRDRRRGQPGARGADVLPFPDRVLHENPRDMSLWQAARYVLSIKTNLVLIVASALGYSFFESARTFGVLFIRRHFGLGQSVAVSLLLILGVGAIAGVLVSGRIADWLARRGHRNARIIVPAVAFWICAGAFAPGISSPWLWVAVPLFTLGIGALAATNPPMDAARLDIMHSRLWGRAESVRTFLRSLLEGAAPLGIGFLADVLGAGPVRTGTGVRLPPPGQGLEYALLVALIPLVAAGAVLLLALPSYARDAATAAESERLTREPASGAARSP